MYSTGSIKTSINDNVINDSNWKLQSVNDNELEMKLNLNGKKYIVRDFDLDDLSSLLHNPHTTNNIKYEELFDKDMMNISPYPQFSYRKTRTNKKRSPKRKNKKSLKKNKKKCTERKKSPKKKKC